MSDQGRCKNCRYFQSQSANPGDAERAPCRQPELEEFQLEVAGDCGCNAFQARQARSEPELPLGAFPEDDASPMMH